MRSLAIIGVLILEVSARAQTPDPNNQYRSTVHARTQRDDGAAAIVISARDLQKRGVQNLAEALELIPEVQVRQGGMGIRLDLRGAKQRSILLLIDGIPVDEPYFGAFDVSAIPITDIVEIRVQLSPASPLEGPGGDGGIVEVSTLRATGGRRIYGRIAGGTTPDGEGAVTGRTPLSQNVGLRASAGARYAAPAYPVVAADKTETTFLNRQSQEYASLRIERATPGGRITGDAWYGHRSFYIPPTDFEGASIQAITGEDAARAVLGGEILRGPYRIALGAYGELLSRTTDFYSDYTLMTKTSHQELLTGRVGGAALMDRSFSRGELGGSVSARLSVDGEGATVTQTMTKGAWGFSTYLEAAVGARLRWRWLRVEAAAGALLPIDHIAGTWPEAKVVVAFQPNPWVSLQLIGARKGRLPSLRELYDPIQGNAKLNPELTWHGELQLTMKPHPLVAARASAYLRQIEGAIRLDPSAGIGIDRRNVNLDTIDVRGLETGIDVARERIIGGALTYIFEDANSPTLGFTAIPNFPRHRVDAYLSSSWKRKVGGLVRFRWVSENFVQGVLLDRYQTLDVSVWGQFSKNLRGTIRVDNVTNEQHEQLPGLRTLGTTATATVEGVWE